MVKNFTPILLPPKLDWLLLAPALGHAREELARYDETLRLVPLPVLEILKWEDSIATIRSQNIETDLLEVLRFSISKEAEEKRATLLQKILNAKDGLDFALRWSLKKPLNTSFLSKLHAILKKDGPNPEEIGRIRKKQNWIGAEGCPIEEAYFFPPKAHLVPKYLKEWASFQNRNQEPLVQLALLFAQLLVIHPFMDGNGRVARDYIPCFLYKKRLLSKPYLFLSDYFQDHLLQYVQKLYDISESGDWESWILYFLKGIVVRSQRMHSQVKRLYKLYLEVGEDEPFLHPVYPRKKKNFTEKSKGVFVFEPLFDAIRG
jgi:cell filamentation protein, protein adenylyltransferase